MTTQMPAAPAQPSRRPTDEVLARLAERIGASFTAASIFGSPVERDGVTIIPVAAVRFGLGGGGGDESSPRKTGDGAGGGGTAAPAGYIEIKDGRSRFVAPLYPGRIAAMCCATAMAMAVILRSRHVR